jgi:hypothetical protein
MCREQQDAVLSYLGVHSDIHVVLLVAAWSTYSEEGNPLLSSAFSREFPSTIATLRDMGKRVIIMGPTPGAPFCGPFGMALARSRDAASPEPYALVSYLSRNATILALSNEAAGRGDADFIDVGPWFCRGGRCAYESDGLPLYRDGGHLNVRGAMSKVDELDAALGAAGLW